MIKELKKLYMNSLLIPADKNALLRRMFWQQRVSDNLGKYYVIHSDPLPGFNPKNSNIIWWLWYQGSQNAPEIVKFCLESVRKYAKEIKYDVIELNEKNLFDYVNIPKQIVDKWKKGNIGAANFSDIVRADLLAYRGGVWLDSTVFLSGAIEQELLNSEVFFYKSSFEDASVTGISSWLMIAKKAGNPYFLSLRDSLIKYWEVNEHTDDYYIFHLFASGLGKLPELKGIYESVPYRSNTYPQILATRLNQKYSEIELRLIFKHSNVHKLTYKGIDKKLEESTYQFLLSTTN